MSETDPEKVKADKEKRDKEALQLDTYKKIASASGVKAEEKPEFNVLESLGNAFTDKHTQSPDFLKIILAIGGLVLGGALGADLPIGGMLMAAVAGAAIIGIGGTFVVDAIRGDDPNQKDAKVAVQRDVPKLNPKTVGQEQVVLPQVDKVGLAQAGITIPVYNAKQNPPVGVTQDQIVQWQHKVEDGNAVTSKSNRLSRGLLAALMVRTDENELNLRAAADTMRAQLPAAVKQTDAYLAKLGPDAQQALSIKPNIDLAKVPGLDPKVYKLPDNLQEYAKEIKSHLAKELAEVKHTNVAGLSLQDSRLINDTIDNMNVVQMRVMIEKFSDTVLTDASMTRASNFEFFPENEKTFATVKYNSQWWNPLAAEKNFRRARANNDYQGMANVLKERLEVESQRPADQKLLSDATKEKMHLIILAAEAKTKTKDLEAYMHTLTEKDMPELKKFETEMTRHADRVHILQARMDEYHRSGEQFLVLSEVTDAQNHQKVKVLDTRSGKPVTKTYTLDTPLPAAKDAHLQALKTLVETGKLVAAAELAPNDKIVALAQSERAPTTLAYTDANGEQTAVQATPNIAKQPAADAGVRRPVTVTSPFA